MLLILARPAPGRPYRLHRYVAHPAQYFARAAYIHTALPSLEAAHQLFQCPTALVARNLHRQPLVLNACRTSSPLDATLWSSCRPLCRRTVSTHSAVQPSCYDELQDGSSDAVSGEAAPGDADQALHGSRHGGRFRPQHSRNFRKSLRQSRPAQVLASLESSARELYLSAPPGKVDLSYTRPYPYRLPSSTPRSRRPSPVTLQYDLARHPDPVSLYSILACFLEHESASKSAKSEHRFTSLELALLHSAGYDKGSVEAWAACLAEPRTKLAAKVFEPGMEDPPLFLLLLFLRRKHLRTFALGTIIRHIDYRVKTKPISWSSLKLLVTRLIRHAREIWPESVPWVASLFVTQATRLHKLDSEAVPLSPKMRSDVTQFCNTLLLLLSLPGTNHPIIYAGHQEKAQLQVLQYMASASPAILVNRTGFRSITRNQLAHAKTAQEKEWAQLKGPSWPPWKENRTAMDEDKDYDFGASRASKVLHRMYEAGYSKRIWEEMAEIYAGWDTDYSPTIQTRTSLPRFSTQYRDVKHLRSLLWASRIRVTRTRREAWACFLAYEMTKAPAHPEIYLAMFEKLHYPIIDRSSTRESSHQQPQAFDQSTTNLLPGDMKEVLSDSQSPQHHVYVHEPIPTYKQFYHRMCTAIGRPSSRLLAFLLETGRDFEMILELLTTTQHNIGLLAAGQHGHDDVVQAIPGYLFAAFIKFLCRFGHFHQPPPETLSFVAPEEHALRFKLDKQYLLEYAYILLVYYQPKYRPAWAAYVDKLVQQKGSQLAGNIPRYRIICKITDIMDQADIDIDDDLFRLVCTSTHYAAQTASQASTSTENAHYVFSTGWSRLRAQFHALVGVNAEIQSHDMAHGTNDAEENNDTILTHVPGPAELHAYVRALGILHDWEGLFSFSIWLNKHHVEVTARAEARRSGSALLFRTLVALRAAVNGGLDPGSDQGFKCPAVVVQLIKAQIEGVEEWGGWPSQQHVDLYVKGLLKSQMPYAGGR